jgi:hypothetical protein
MELNMKKLFLFSTKIYHFWTLIPLVVLLVASIMLNENVDSIMKLYPLIILSSAGIIFILLFFIRGIVLSYDDARCVGLFSKKDYARYSTDYYLQVTTLKRGRLLIEVFGFIEEGGIGYDWYATDEKAEINLLRARANGNLNTLKRILTYYGLDDLEAKAALSAESYNSEVIDAFIHSELLENKSRRIKITFKELSENNEEDETDAA